MQKPTLVPMLAKVTSGVDLNSTEAETALDAMMSGDADLLQVSGLLAGLQAKGLAPTEIEGGVRALQKAMVPVVHADPDSLVDTCGTGGGSVPTFNISTAAAFVAAGAGVVIAKHGNRSFTSKSGSADVLEALGVDLSLDPEALGQVLADVGIVFMFAPKHHPAVRHVGPVRKALGVRTIMNLLGPLSNPARARRQVVGVSDPELVDLIAQGLQRLGHRRALVVHGAPGMDELSPCGTTTVVELREGTLERYTIDVQEDLGLHPVDPGDLVGGEPGENATLVKGILEGRDQGPRRSAVLVNAAAALYVGGQASSLHEGVQVAADAIDTGAAVESLRALVQATTRG